MSEFAEYVAFMKDAETVIKARLSQVQLELDEITAQEDEIHKRQQRLVGIRNSLQSAYGSLLSERLHQGRLEKAEEPGNE